MDTTQTPDEALQQAVSRAGSQSEFARICGVSQPSVWKWLNGRKPLPAEHVLAVESATGVSRHELRPDIYPLHTAPVVLGQGTSSVSCGRSGALQPEVAR